MKTYQKKVIIFKNLLFLLKTFNMKETKIYSISLLILISINSFFPLINIVLTEKLLNALQLGYTIELILYIVVFLLIAQVVQLLFSSLSSYLNDLFQLKLENIVTQLVMKKTSKVRLQELFSNETIDKLYFLRTNSTSKMGTLFNSTTTILSSIITFIATFSYLFKYIPFYTILVVISSIPIAFTQIYFNKKNFELSKSLNIINRKQFYLLFISTTPEYLKEIVQHSSMGLLINSYKRLFKEIFNPIKSLSSRIMVVNVVTSLLGIITIIYAQYNTILMVIGGSMLIGTLMSIFQSLGVVFQKLQNIILSFSGFHNDLLYIDNLREFLELKERPSKIISTNPIYNISIRANNISYDIEGKSIFKNINFEFEKGNIIGIKGQNGVGKSTLIDIIQGIKKQTSGDLYFNEINSENIAEKDRLELSQTLRQNPPKYEFTLEDNIAISNYQKQNIDILDYIKSHDPNSFILKEAINLRTMLGEWYDNSKQLSGGQWQLIALFRLLFKDSPIYLLDEPTNNLDSSSIQVLKNMISKVSENALVIIVSHDNSFLNDICTQTYNMTKNELAMEKGVKKVAVTV